MKQGAALRRETNVAGSLGPAEQINTQAVSIELWTSRVVMKDAGSFISVAVGVTSCWQPGVQHLLACLKGQMLAQLLRKD